MTATNVIDYGQYNWWPYPYLGPYPYPSTFITTTTSPAACVHCWCGEAPKRNHQPHVQCCKCSDVTLKKG